MKMSLKIKTVCMILLVGIILTGVAAVISYRVYSGTMDEHYRSMTMNLAKTEATVLDGQNVQKVTEAALNIYRQICEENGGVPNFDQFTDEDWEKYYSRYDQVVQSSEYDSILKQLQNLEKANDVLSMYICYMDIETGKAIYIVDGAFEDPCLMGTCDDIEEGNLQLMQQNIHDFPAYITNYEEYGWLCSAAAGIYDENGQILGNAYVDISMDAVMQEKQQFLMQLCVVLAVATVALVLLLVWGINKTVVRPINSLANAASSFIKDREKQEYYFDSAISNLYIKTGDEIEALVDAIKKMELEINTYIANITTITAEKERIGVELNVATQIQADMLPNIFPAFPEHKEFDIYASMLPAKEVGGDFYDFFMVDEEHLAFIIADVSGKGVPAALFMVIAKTLIKNRAQNKEKPAEIFYNVNNQLCENNEVGMFVTAWLGIMNIKTGHVDYVNAGHNYPLVVRKDGTVEWVKSRPDFVLAGMEGMRYQQHELQLDVGDIIYLYTDGVTEALDTTQELYGDERLEKCLSVETMKDEMPEAVLQHVAKDLAEFARGAEQADDITMVALKIREREIQEPAGNMVLWEGEAKREALESILELLEPAFEQIGFNMAQITQLSIAVEEIFVNIASYAYERLPEGEKTEEQKHKKAVIKCYTDEETKTMTLCFEDWGVPYNPLEKADLDITLSAEEREIGGLGIYMVKKSMDDVRYENKDGKNCFTLVKKV